MDFRIENLGILFGLFALVVPIILHFFRRRHHDIIDWGAMQFLPDNVTAHRKRWLDEILLMLMRMAMIALIVIALATPKATSSLLSLLGDQSSREVVIVLDGSYSMGLRVPGEPTPWQAALEWRRDHVEQGSLRANFTTLIARQPPIFVRDDDIATLTPTGNPDMPRALKEAWAHLQRSVAANKEIIVLTDGQHHGWADLQTLAELDNLGKQWHIDLQQAKHDGVAAPSLRVVKVGPALPKMLVNYSLAPLTSSRGFVKQGKEITFESALHLNAPAGRPRSAKVLIDRKEVKELPLPDHAEFAPGQIPLTFAHTFDREGQFVVSLVVDVDDALPTDNKQHLVVEVVKELPILLVDGDDELSVESSTYFLQKALGLKHAIAHTALTPAAILPDAADAVKPAVIVLADVPHLDKPQLDALERFLAEGGGLLVIAGERVAGAKAFYNDQLYRGGQGWLPAKLGAIATSTDGMQPDPRTFQHPALDLFRGLPDGSLNQVRFPKWWKVSLGSRDRAVAVARLTNGDPLFLEQPYKQGRVMMCTAPFDRRWGSKLPIATEFPILPHELTKYLAGSRNAASTLRQGAPIRLIGSDASMKRLTLHTPEIAATKVSVKQWPWVYENTGAIGVYRVQTAERSWSHVVPPDLRESDLARCTDDDRRKIRERLPIAWHSEEPAADTLEEPRREDLWWLLLVGVLGLLCSEVWMTRRMALARGRL